MQVWCCSRTTGKTQAHLKTGGLCFDLETLEYAIHPQWFEEEQFAKKDPKLYNAHVKLLVAEFATMIKAGKFKDCPVLTTSYADIAIAKAFGRERFDLAIIRANEQDTLELATKRAKEADEYAFTPSIIHGWTQNYLNLVKEEWFTAETVILPKTQYVIDVYKKRYPKATKR